MIVCQSTPQKLPTFDSTSALSPSVSAAQGLEEKQLSSGAHSSPRGQGVLFSQFCACCSYEVPQKFVFTIGAKDGDKDAAKSDGDRVSGKFGDAVTDWDVFVSSSMLGCNVCVVEVVNDGGGVGRSDSVASSVLFMLG